VPSALAQTVGDLEILIVGDGMPPEAAEVAREVAALDGRVRLLEHPKGPRHGETYRHAAVADARGRHVFYLSDDDLWLPDHVERLSGLLDAHDAHFVNTRSAARLGDGTWVLANVDLAMAFHRDAMRSHFNRVGLSDAGHTLAAYHRLPHGWRTTPDGTPTDLHMWRQWIEQPWVRFVSSPIPTALHFPSHERRDMPIGERLRELEEHRGVREDPVERLEWLTRVVADGFPRAAWLEAHWQEQGAWLEDREAALAWHVERLAEAVASIEWLSDALAQARAAG
jgi:GalNAc5-diNAcBac-PP-undecaprenol beta-1,3-glucosyltransferase